MADTLSKLAKPEGATKPKTRKGRGVGSGLGKTAGRGQKGQFARTRGFNNPFPTKTAEVNVGDLEIFAAGAKVDEKALRDHGLVKGACDRIKILGEGDLTKAVIVTAHSFSKAAAAKIEKAGGKAQLLAAAAASA